MKKGSHDEPRVEDIVFYPAVDCGVCHISTTTYAQYINAVAFAKAHKDDCLRELEKVKLEYPNFESSSILTSLFEAIAHARIWARYQNGWGTRKPTSPKPTPRPTNARSLENA